MFLVRVLVCIGFVVIGFAIIAVGFATARDYRHIASNRYESFVAYNPFGWLRRGREKLDFARYKRYISLPWIFFGCVVVALGINGLAHL
jgi:hypothetical protein